MAMTDEVIYENLLIWAKEHCNGTWTTEIPAGVVLFANQGVEYIRNQTGVSSESFGDWSASYFEELPKGLLRLLNPYRKPKFV